MRLLCASLRKHRVILDKDNTLPDEFLVLIARLDEHSQAMYPNKESSGLVKHALARHLLVLGFLISEHG